MGARYIEPVYRSVVIERDKGICQLCYKPVDLTLKYPDLGSASVDHIIPVSKEGDHSYANVQLAHLGCNLEKKNRMPVLGFCP